MIYIYVKSFSATGSPRERQAAEGLAARELLFSALLHELELLPLEIAKTDTGKPYFADAEYPPFSISHTDGAIAIAIADGCESVGVDIERLSPRLSDERLTDRFFPDISYAENEINEIKTVTAGEISPARDGAPARFTLGEAIIKCDGGGFASSGNARLLSQRMKKSSYTVVLESGEYSLSVAVKEREN